MKPGTERKRYRLAVAIVTLSLGMAPIANAGTIYAFAENIITNFEIQSAPGSIADISGGRNTSNSALFGITNDSTEDPETIPLGSDALQAVAGAGPFPGEDNFIVFEALGVLDGARADSETNSGNPFTGAGGTGVPLVANVAEAGFSGPGDQSATSSGSNTAEATFTITSPTALTFAFSDSIALMASTSSIDESANAAIANSFEIAELNGTQVFLYTPEACGTGSLQGSVGSAGGVPSQNTVTAACSVSGTSSVLAPGQYEVSLRTTSQVDVSTASPTPEPSELLMVGTGLIAMALVFGRRIRSK
jgi:hypothetical protein